MIAVVFRKRKTSKPQMVVYTKESRMTVDKIIDGAKRKPPIPNNWYLDDIGVGESYVEIYQNKYKKIKTFYDKAF